MSTDGPVSNRIRELRAARYLTQEALARRAKVSVFTINAVERGRRTAQVVTQEKIARALRVPRTEVFPEPATTGRRGSRA